MLHRCIQQCSDVVTTLLAFDYPRRRREIEARWTRLASRWMDGATLRGPGTEWLI